MLYSSRDKNAFNGILITLDITRDKINELKDGSVELIQTKT